ncbi:hypothetical protein [Clostridium felsineum]|uniref:hypothetical protein n=1 Tax=Clostridium felsineum TaxID=36839 RepID=UPI0009D5911D|nr:hypothetical protein [Clostridium felsineum]URZ01257.1 hypothetical protein CLAUR_012460 [Clostridium felsineum]
MGLINTSKGIKYVCINSADTKQEAELAMEYYVKNDYKNELISYGTIDINELECI